MVESPVKIIKNPSYWNWGNIYQFASLASSNTFLKKNLDNFNPYDIIWVLHQWAGKGKYSNKWYGHKNESLTFSIVLNDFLKNYSTFALTQIVALAVSQALEHWQIISSIKFPNDILINNQKVAGILTESCHSKEQKKFFIVGIGINVNFQKKSQEVIEQNFTSVNQYSLHSIGLEELLEKILGQIKIHLQSWEKSQFNDFIEKWKFKNTMLNKYVKITVRDSVLPKFELVKVISIDRNCDLVVLSKNSEAKKISSLDVLY